MPKEKKKSTVIHPNSRKAMKLSRMEHRGMRLIKRKEEALSKLKGKMNKLRWFKDNIDTSKTLYTDEDVHELIQKYFERFNEEEEKIKEVGNIKGRHIQNRISQDYKIKFSVEQEKRNYETCGIEIPKLTQKESFDFFKEWNKDPRFLSKIDLVVVSKPAKCK